MGARGVKALEWCFMIQGLLLVPFWGHVFRTRLRTLVLHVAWDEMR
jgi:hypothetical protein